MKKNVLLLKYSEYKKTQALFLQQMKNSERFVCKKGYNTEMICLHFYIEYLEISGELTKEIYEKIGEYINNVQTYWIGTSFHSFNKYDENIAKNIDNIMDELMSKNYI
jgi:DNA mismatch repair ATPase MutS